MNLNKIKVRYILAILLVLTVLGGFLRFYQNTKNPISLSIDEVAFGYNAYSILKTGRDEYGKFLPLTFKSTGDYKNPVPAYLMVPSIALFGLNEFSIRLPTALIATLSISLFFLLFMEITRSRVISLVAAALLTISPWHIYFSRYVSELLIAASFVVLGVWCFLKMIRAGRWFWATGSALSFILSMYTYYAERLFVPLLVLALLFFYRGDLKRRFKQVRLFILICFIVASPLIFSVFLGPDIARAQMTWIGNDVEFVRNIAIKPLENIPLLDSNNLLLFFFGVRKYLNYFDPSFLFFTGLNLTRAGSYGLGVLYLFEIPFLAFGVIELFKSKILKKGLILSWILIGLIPASLTNNEQHPGRTFVILPMMILISAIGAVHLFNYLKLKLNRKLFIFALAVFLIVVLWNLTQSFLIYWVHFPRQKGEDFMEGTKEVVQYALAHKDQYQEIVLDPYRGIVAPNIVSIPHMYILFYSGYDPAIYQKEEKIRPDGSFGFDNFTIRKIDWRTDRFKKDTLFIGTPWSLPANDIENEKILKKAYLSGGQLVFLIVSPYSDR